MKEIINILKILGGSILVILALVYGVADKKFFYDFTTALLIIPVMLIIGWLVGNLLNKIRQDKQVIIPIFLYIIYCFVIYQMLRRHVHTEFIMIFTSLGLIFIASYDKLKEHIKYIFSTYQFFIFLFVSNEDWIIVCFGFEYENKKIFLLLILSAPTIAYGIYRYLRNKKI